MSFIDDNQITINILSSGLGQNEVFIIIHSQAVCCYMLGLNPEPQIRGSRK